MLSGRIRFARESNSQVEAAAVFANYSQPIRALPTLPFRAIHGRRAARMRVEICSLKPRPYFFGCALGGKTPFKRKYIACAA